MNDNDARCNSPAPAVAPHPQAERLRFPKKKRGDRLNVSYTTLIRRAAKAGLTAEQLVHLLDE